jgi:NAD(P)H dehydrogenase (quinone)
MIVITGATGALNGATVEALLARGIPADRIAVSVRDAAKAAALAARGVEVREASYDDPAALAASFAGAEQVLLVSSNDPHGDTVAQHRTAVDAAAASGARRILYTSHQGAGAGSPFFPARHHAATEDMLAASGVAWTSLRNGFYLHSLQWLLGPWRETGVVRVPGEGRVSWTDRTDAAEGAAAILAGDLDADGIDGPVTMTASAAPTFEEVTAELSEVTGSAIGFEVLDPEDWIAASVAAGAEERMTRFLLGMYQAAAEGRFAGTDPTLARLLGREPRTVREYLSTFAG